MIKTKTRPYYAMPNTVHQRIKVLAAMYGCTQSAVIGLSVAHLEGGYGCSNCGVYIGDKPLGKLPKPNKPPAPNSKQWAELAEHHTAGCKWILTRGFQL